MNERPIRNTDEPLRGDLPPNRDQRPSQLSYWAMPAALFVSWRAAKAADAAYAAARARGATRDIAANAAFKSMTGEDRRIGDDGDEERIRCMIDMGHGAPPLRARGPATEMDLALGALASHRDAAQTNADTYVVALCVLAFASLALLGRYPIHSVRTGDAAAARPPAIDCEQDAEPIKPSHGMKIRTTCR